MNEGDEELRADLSCRVDAARDREDLMVENGYAEGELVSQGASYGVFVIAVY
jgi:hypothetical protein